MVGNKISGIWLFGLKYVQVPDLSSISLVEMSASACKPYRCKIYPHLFLILLVISSKLNNILCSFKVGQYLISRTGLEQCHYKRFVRSPWKWARDAASDQVPWRRRGIWVTTEPWLSWGQHSKFPYWNSGTGRIGQKWRHGCMPKGKQQPLNFSFNQNSNLLLKKRHDRKLSASPVKNNSSNSTFDPCGRVGRFSVGEIF